MAEALKIRLAARCEAAGRPENEDNFQVAEDLPEPLMWLSVIVALPVLLGRFLFIPYIVGAVLTGFYIHGLRKWDRSSGTVILFVVLLVLSIVGYVVMELLFANLIDGLMSV